MNIYTTIIKAIDPKDGQLKTWSGPRISAITFEGAKNYLYNNGLCYCEVDGQLIAEIDEFTDERIDYEKTQLN